MARMPRIVVSGYPHHVTQRGNRRQQTFFCDNDFRYYIELLSGHAQQTNTEIWAYCLMPNHVAIPGTVYLIRFRRVDPKARGFNWRNPGTQTTGPKTKARVIKYTVPGITELARLLCNKYRMATALARASSHCVGLDFEAGFFELASKDMICAHRPDRDNAFGAEFFVDCF